jgi:hypothetical protein
MAGSGWPEERCSECGREDSDHLFSVGGAVRLHRPVLVQAEAEYDSALCRVGCGLLRNNGVHVNMKPIFLPEEPVTTTVETTIPAVAAWDAFSAQVRDTIVRKSQGYGNAWQAQGYMGNLARVLSKTSRLKNILWKDDQSNGIGASVGGESLADTLVDLGALAAFLSANFEEGNRWGQ